MKKIAMLNGCQVVAKINNYNIFQIIWMSLRLIPAAILICLALVFQEYIRPYITSIGLRRYLSCIVNLLCFRSVLALLGFFHFECQNYSYFDKRPEMLVFRSGWVGMATHKNVIDFFYYAYLFNPVFTRLIEFHNDEGYVKMLYTPLTFQQAFLAALTHRGFDPIVVRGEKQLVHLKKRKLQLIALASECHEEMAGPILIMLPGIIPNEHIAISKEVGRDIYNIQRRFHRSGVLFLSEIQLQEIRRFAKKRRHHNELFDKIYLNQIHLIMDLCSRFSANCFNTKAYPLVRKDYKYTSDTYSQNADELIRKQGLRLKPISYEDYLAQMNKFEESIATSEN